MNPGRCKKCNADIIWVPNPRGGWLRPMERFDARLDVASYDLLHGREVYLALDGGISLVRGSSLLVWHECPPEMQEDVFVPRALGDPLPTGELVLQGTGEMISDERLEEIIAARVEAELQRHREHREAEQIVRDRKVRAADSARAHAEQLKTERTKRAEGRAFAKHGKAVLVDCPNCGAEPGELCRRKQMGSAGTFYDQPFVENAHRERWNWAYGSGTVEENMFAVPIGPVSRSTEYRRMVTRATPPRAADGGALVEWLGKYGPILWSEIRTIDSEPVGEDVSLFGNPADDPADAGTD